MRKGETNMITQTAHQIVTKRPDPILMAYWREQIVIEENAVILTPVYWEVA